jgi:molybdopterin-guanine dinucleotide biosynthesis protein A
MPQRPNSARQSLQFEAFLSQPSKTPNRLVEKPKTKLEERKDSHVPVPSRQEIEELFASIHELNQLNEKAQNEGMELPALAEVCYVDIDDQQGGFTQPKLQ